jgi:hypothetical protein
MLAPLVWLVLLGGMLLSMEGGMRVRASISALRSRVGRCAQFHAKSLIELFHRGS